MRGNKPKPTKIKKLLGIRPDRINENEPEVVGNFPTCPVGLGPEAKKEWKRIRHATKFCPYITTLDRGILMAYCTAVDMFWRCLPLVQKTGPFIITKSGNIVQNPALSGMNKAMEQILKLGASLGFSPAERSRMVISRKGKGKKPTELESLLD